MAGADAWTKRVLTAFSSSQAAGLFALAATKPEAPPSPVFSFWRSFASQYMTRLCRTPEFTGDLPSPVDLPDESDLTRLLLSSPPMHGGEYLSRDVLADVWRDLDSWVRKEIAASDGGFSAWLKTHASMWRQVGRVCFHLAENKRDPEFPFAFMATYAPSLSGGGRVQYQPLAQALREYAGERNKGGLISLLLPVHRASEHIDFVKELAELIDGLSGIQRRGLVLAYLMKFKQICNHPSHFLGDGVYAPDDSGKFGRLGTICEEIASRQEKVLVFTQFREMTDPIASFLGGIFGREGLVLHGGTQVKQRRVLIDLFQREDGPPFFVLSLKAGGTGLNLTAASHVIHFDRWWNPAVENQATDRAFRIGQNRNVIVHKFVCRGTVEEKTVPAESPVTRQQIKTLRERFGMSREEFARLVGVSAQTVKNWETLTGALVLQARTATAIDAIRKKTKKQAWRLLSAR